MADNSQKFIARNRAPRVQIEYDVELYGAEKKVQLPFVMGVMSDLLGKSTTPQPSVEDRKFLEIDIDSFDNRMKGLAPRAAFRVPNTLTGEGNLDIDLTFESMGDFTPGAIASKVDALRPLLEARQQLQTLMAYMDGKAGAEGLIEHILQDPALLSALAAGDSAGAADQDTALDSLRRIAQPKAAEDQSAEVLAALRNNAPAEVPAADDRSDVLRDLARSTVSEPEQAPPAPAAILDDLAASAPPEPQAAEGAVDDVLQELGALGAKDSAEADAIEDSLAQALDSLDAPVEQDEEPTGDILKELAAQDRPEEGRADNPKEEDLSQLLGDLAAHAPAEAAEAAPELGDILESLSDTEAEQETGPEVADILSDVASHTPEADPSAPEDAALADILGDLDLQDDAAEDNPDLGELLADLAQSPVETDTSDAVDLDDILAGLEPAAEESVVGEDPDAVLSGLAAEAEATPPVPAPSEDDLSELLADLDAPSDPATAGSAESDLDDLLGDLAEGPGAPEAATLAADLSDLDDLLGDMETEPEKAVPEQDVKPIISEPEFAYGTITAQRPSSQQLQRKRFRIALFGDFSGRAARGQIEIGATLAARPPIVLDPDTLEEVIEGFACDLVLPLGAEDAEQEAISVTLSEFDDLHPDELFENVALFSELVSLRKQLQSGVTVDHASRSLADWAKRFGTPVRVPKRASGGQAVPADRRLSAFQQLIGDQDNSLREVSALDTLLARIVGPHIHALPNPDVAAMQQAVDAALSDAMRLVLHHPEFQSVEAQWRSLDLIARSVEVDDTLEVVLYDVSAEELAADLAAQDDLSQSGLTRLLTEAPLDPETGRGGYSALIGLYGFEETPPHAELLGRIARVAAHVDAPFFTSLSPGFLQTSRQDRAPLVASAWDTLQQMPEAGHLGLASPRFLLRRPYGAKSDPLDSFAFEEFTQSEGLRGMLWGNPVVLVTILLARSFKENGAAMQLGSIMSLGDMPYHTVTDRFGDQVALPCTERNIDLDKIALANDRGVMAVSAVKGRDELRLTSFFSIAGAEILGPWSGVPAPAPSPADPREKTGPAARQAQPDSASETGQEPASTPTDWVVDPGGDDLDLEGTDTSAGGDSDLDDLDALLAGFDAEGGVDGGSDTADSGEMDAELAALLADL